MGKEAKINTSFANEPDDVFYTMVMLIYNSLKANAALFPGLLVEMGDLDPLETLKFGGAITIYNNTRLMPIYVGKTADVAKAREDVQKMVTKNGNWLNTFCQGDTALLKKTGYPLAKADEAQGKLEQSAISLVPVKEGMSFTISHVQGSHLRYGVMYTLASNPETNPAKWSYHYAAHRQGTIRGLESEAEYKFVSFAMGTSIDLTYSRVLRAKTL